MPVKGRLSGCRRRESGEQGSVDFAVTTNGGKTWKARVAAYGTGADFSGVSCPSTQECFAVGGDILATKNGGATWADQTAVLQALFLAVSCPSSNECFAVGTSSAANDVIYATRKAAAAGSRACQSLALVPSLSTACPAHSKGLRRGGWLRHRRNKERRRHLEKVRPVAPTASVPKPVSLTVAATMVRRKVCHFWSLRSGTHDTELVRAGGCIGCTIQVVVARETVGVKIAR